MMPGLRDRGVIPERIWATALEGKRLSDADLRHFQDQVSRLFGPASATWKGNGPAPAGFGLGGIAKPLFEQPPVETPHDWDDTKRVCKRCGVTSADWFDGKAGHWINGKAPTCPPTPAQTEPAEEDWFKTVGRRLKEIEAEKEHPLVVVNIT